MSEIVNQEGTFKMQKRKPAMKKLNVENKVATVATAKAEVTKVDLNITPAEEPVVVVIPEVVQVIEPEVINTIVEIPNVELPVEVLTEEVKQVIQEQNPGRSLPENIEKLVLFMEETNGTVEDYVRLNADYSTASPDVLLREYYRKSRPHLDAEEIQFIMEENFSYDDDLDDDRDIKRKKLAFKEEVNKARAFLDDTKTKYYDEIKLRPSVNKDQQKAMDFFNRYNAEQESVEQQHEGFKTNTKQFFSQDFKGFDFNLGEKSFRYGVSNPEAVADKQSNITNLIKKFLDKDGQVTDVQGYHKAIYAADNADSLAKHFYEQGKADALKEVVAKSNNISTEPRQNASNLNVGGFKVRAINGVDTSKLRIQKRH